jgi:hypothetical protein
MEPIKPFITVICACAAFVTGMFIMTMAQSCQ